jgi:hypothetical protein
MIHSGCWNWWNGNESAGDWREWAITRDDGHHWLSDNGQRQAVSGFNERHLYFFARLDAPEQTRIEDFQLLLDGYLPDSRPLAEIRLPIRVDR